MIDVHALPAVGLRNVTEYLVMVGGYKGKMEALYGTTLKPSLSLSRSEPALIASNHHSRTAAISLCFCSPVSSFSGDGFAGACESGICIEPS